jgi:hypothetical protein
MRYRRITPRRRIGPCRPCGTRRLGAVSAGSGTRVGVASAAGLWVMLALGGVALAGCGGGPRPGSTPSPVSAGASPVRASDYVLDAHEGPQAPGFDGEGFRDLLARLGVTQDQLATAQAKAVGRSGLSPCVNADEQALDEAIGAYFINEQTGQVVSTAAAVVRPADLERDVAVMRSPAFANCLRPAMVAQIASGVGTTLGLTAHTVNSSALVTTPPPGAVTRVTTSVLMDVTDPASQQTRRVTASVDAVLLAKGNVESMVIADFEHGPPDDALIGELVARLAGKLPAGG